MSYCPNCNRNKFELESVDIAGKKLNFIQCAECKAPIGVIESDSLGLTEILRVLVTSLQRLNSRLERIERALGD